MSDDDLDILNKIVGFAILFLIIFAIIFLINSLEKENECLKSQLDKIPSKIKEVWLEDD